jgi:hypothetical protein
MQAADEYLGGASRHRRLRRRDAILLTLRRLWEMSEITHASTHAHREHAHDHTHQRSAYLHHDGVIEHLPTRQRQRCNTPNRSATAHSTSPTLTFLHRLALLELDVPAALRLARVAVGDEAHVLDGASVRLKVLGNVVLCVCVYVSTRCTQQTRKHKDNLGGANRQVIAKHCARVALNLRTNVDHVRESHMPMTHFIVGFLSSRLCTHTHTHITRPTHTHQPHQQTITQRHHRALPCCATPPHARIAVARARVAARTRSHTHTHSYYSTLPPHLLRLALVDRRSRIAPARAAIVPSAPPASAVVAYVCESGRQATGMYLDSCHRPCLVNDCDSKRDCRATNTTETY